MFEYVTCSKPIVPTSAIVLKHLIHPLEMPFEMMLWDTRIVSLFLDIFCFTTPYIRHTLHSFPKIVVWVIRAGEIRAHVAKTEQADKMVTKKQSDMNSEIPRKPNPLAAKCCFGIQISPPVVLLLYQVCYQSELLKSMTRDVQTKCLSFFLQNHMSLCQLLTVTRSSMEWAVLYSWTDLENNCQLQNFNFIKAGYCSCYSNQTMQLNTTHSNQINATLLKREFFQWFTKPPIWSAGKSSGLVENTWQNWMTTRQWPAC